MTMYCISILSH